MGNYRSGIALFFLLLLGAYSSVCSYALSTKTHHPATTGRHTASSNSQASGSHSSRARTGSATAPRSTHANSGSAHASSNAHVSSSHSAGGAAKGQRSKSAHTTKTAKQSINTASSTGRTSRRGRGRRTAIAAAPSHKMHGQQAIAPERVTQIQEALIREHYLSGEANGSWDSETMAAMQKWQGDHGWQTRLMPDSRALKTLGLGPDYSGAINANGSSFAAPAPASTIPAPQVDGFAAAAGIKK